MAAPSGGERPSTPPRAGFKWVYKFDETMQDYNWVEEADPDYKPPAKPVDVNASKNPDGSIAGSLDDIVAKGLAQREKTRIAKLQSIYLQGGGGSQLNPDGSYTEVSYMDDQGIVHRMDGSVGGQPSQHGGGKPSWYAGESKFTPTNTTKPAPIAQPAYTGNVKMPVENGWKKIVGRVSKWSWNPAKGKNI